MEDEYDVDGNPKNPSVIPAGETWEQRAIRLEKEKALETESKNRLYARLKTEQGFTQDADGKWIKPTVDKKPEISEVQSQPTIQKASDILKADEFKLYRAGYTEAEIDLIMHNGGAKILEDKANPLVLGLQAAKEQRGAEDAASRVSDSSGLSDIERKYTEQDMRNMKKEDLEALIPHVNK